MYLTLDPVVVALATATPLAVTAMMLTTVAKRFQFFIVSPKYLTGALAQEIPTVLRESSLQGDLQSNRSTMLRVRFDTDLQKLLSPVHAPKHWLNDTIAPLMTTSFGLSPRPATLV